MDNVEAKNFDEEKGNGSRDVLGRGESQLSKRDRDLFHDLAQNGIRRRSNTEESGYDRDGHVWNSFPLPVQFCSEICFKKMLNLCEDLTL